MARIKIKHFITRSRRRDGRKTYYWSPSKALREHGWKLKRLSDDYGTAIQQAEDLNAQVDAWRAGLSDDPETYLYGTVEHLIATYKKAREYKELSDRTRRDYDYYLNIINNWAGDRVAVNVTARSCNNLYESLYQNTPTKAAYLMRVLRLLFSFAERRDLIPKNTNPATQMNIKNKTPKQEIWTPEDVTLMIKTADDMGYFSYGTAILLNEWMGQRPSDIISMTMNAYKNGEISIIQSKTGQQVFLPVDIEEKLKHRLDEQIRINMARRTPGTHLIQQENGAPFKPDWFSHLFTKMRRTAAPSVPADDRARFNRITFQTLRHTAVTRLAESGCSLHEIAAITGHSLKTCQAIIDRYSIRTKEMAKNAYTKRKQSEEKKT